MMKTVVLFPTIFIDFHEDLLYPPKPSFASGLTH